VTRAEAKRVGSANTQDQVNDEVITVGSANTQCQVDNEATTVGSANSFQARQIGN